jgi:tripartite-type tricarboxylate transporter receptor subunit TctC
VREKEEHLMRIVFALLHAAALAVPSAVMSQPWPAKAVRLVVATGPGLSVDIMARILAEGVSRSLGQPVVVDNIPGAAGMIGAQTVARAPANGYTFYFASSSTLTSNLYVYKSLPYDPVNDFTAVAIVVDSSPFVVSAVPTLPVKTLPELIDHAKANPGKLSYAFDSSSGSASIVGRLLAKRTGIDIIGVPYKSTAQALQDTVTGRTQFIISAVVPVEPYLKRGALKSLALTSDNRFPGLEEVPLVRETLPGFRMDGWFAVVTRVGTPAEAVARFNRDINQFLANAELVQKMRGLGLAMSRARTPHESADFIHNEQERWKKLAAELELQPQ